MKEIKLHSKWTAMADIDITIGSHSQNPNGTSVTIPIGTTLTWDGDSPNGNVWFVFYLDDVQHRGKIECGTITNLIKRGAISILDNGDSFIVYNGPYLKKLLTP
jgi:hypothetical protein